MKSDFQQPFSHNDLSTIKFIKLAGSKMILLRWMVLNVVLSMVLSVIALPALAEETKSSPLAVMVGFESANGGDKVGTLVVTEKDTGDVKAGSGMHFYLGMLYRPVTLFEARLTAGYQMDRSPTSTGTVFMDRYPIEFTPTLCYESHRFGAGVTYHTNIKLHGNDFGQDDIRFKNALGFTIEYGYKIAPFLFLGFRYVNISYDLINPDVTLDGERTVNANHFGINLYYQY